METRSCHGPTRDLNQKDPTKRQRAERLERNTTLKRDARYRSELVDETKITARKGPYLLTHESDINTKIKAKEGPYLLALVRPTEKLKSDTIHRGRAVYNSQWRKDGIRSRRRPGLREMRVE